jgi:ribosomal protein L24
MSFFNKGVSDLLVQASSDILNAKPQYSIGDTVFVKEGPNAGMNGRVVGSKSSGYTDVQLIQGRQITVSNDYITPPSNMLNEAKKDDEEEEDNGKPFDFKGKKKKKSKKDFFKKNDDDEDDEDDDDDEDKSDDDDEEGLPKNAKKKSKAGGKGEDIKINPKLEEIHKYHRQANVIQAARAMSILTNK